MQTIKPYLLFIGMLLFGIAFTAVVASYMDERAVDQEQQREETHT